MKPCQLMSIINHYHGYWLFNHIYPLSTHVTMSSTDSPASCSALLGLARYCSRCVNLTSAVGTSRAYDVTDEAVVIQRAESWLTDFDCGN